MKSFALALCLAASAALAAQTAPKPAAPAAKPSSTATKSAAPATHAATTAAYKVPAGDKRYPGIARSVLSDSKYQAGWRYQDVKVGAGAMGEHGKMWHMKYKGWRAVDGVVFDSWENNKRPQMKDGKPVMGPDNKPLMGDPQPLEFPQGVGRLIPGFDWGVAGMRIGGKRRIFIPADLAYGARAIPDRPDHPGIPANSDLIFDVELVDVTEPPAPPQRPMMPPRPMPRPGTQGGAPGTPGAPPKPTEASPAGQPATPPPSAAPSTAPAPGTPPKPATPTPNPGSQPESKPAPPPSK